MIGGAWSSRQLKTLQAEMSEVILTFSSLKDRLKGVEHTVHKHSSFITDLGRSSARLSLVHLSPSPVSNRPQETPKTRSSLSWTRSSRR